VLGRALDIHKHLVEYQTSDPVLRQAIGNGFRRVGDIHQSLGESKKAEEAYRQGIGLLKQLADEFSAVPRYRYELAGINAKFGLMLVDDGRPRQAEEPLRRSVALYDQVQEELTAGSLEQRLEALKPGNLTGEEEEALRRSLARRQQRATQWRNRFRNERANAHGQLGRMLAATRRPREAGQAYQRALDQLGKLVADDPDEPSHRLALACVYQDHADLHRDAGRLPEAEQACLKAQELLQRLATDLPKTPVCRQCLARNLDSLGLLLEATGRRQQAEEAFGKSLELKQGLANDFPDRTAFQYLLAVGRMRQGQRLEAANQYAKAEQTYRGALARLDKLVANDRDVTEFQHQQACCQSALAKLLVITRRPREAEKLLRQAYEVYQKLRAGTRFDLRHDLADNRNTLALLLEATGRAQEAIAVYEQAIALWEALAGQDPKVASHLSNLGMALGSLARTLNARKEWGKARPLAERAVRQQKAALRLKPGDAAYGRLLHDHYLTLAESYTSLRRPGDAARVADKIARGARANSLDCYFAADILMHCTALVQADDRLSLAERQARVREYIARIKDLLRELGRQSADNPQAAKAVARFLAVYALPGVSDPEQAIGLARQAIQRSPEDAISHSTLGMALYRTGRYPEAITALNKALKLGSGDALDSFFLAMAYRRVGDKDGAALWYKRAAAWMAKNQPDRRDLQMIRAEAAALLGLGK
jgi:tetratricopeptide (TPR) repeat protein